MRLYLVQHGAAVPKDVDPERPLTPEGHADVQRLAAFLGRAGVHAHRVRHSGKLRARQTAEMLGRAVAPSGAIEARSGMDPMDDPEPVAREVATWPADTMLVGHQPFLGQLVSVLVLGDMETEVVTFKPGSVVCVERADEGGWAVGWLVRPELLAGEGR